MGNRIIHLVESNILACTESFYVPAITKLAAKVNLLLNRIKLVWPEVILLSHCKQYSDESEKIN